MIAVAQSAAPAEGKVLDIARPTIIQARKKKSAKEDRTKIFERKYPGSNTQIRPGLAENYEGKKSDREHWWRTYIKETPVPGSYQTEAADTFILDLDKSIKTYSFKSDGRRLEAHKYGKGAALLPGAYEFQDLMGLLNASRRTYTFKNTGREGRDLLNEGLKDKDVNVPPNLYHVEKYLATEATDPAYKSYTFKSASKRFPTIYFTPKEGPAPGAYDSKRILTAPSISSSFKSTTPRFQTSHTKVPGPGMYEPTFQNPQPKTIRRLGRLHGLFFSCSFQN